MIPREFVKKYYPAAIEAEVEYGITCIAILAQAAVETGWGERVKGNNFFGIKARGDWNGDATTFRTKEVHSSPNYGNRYYKVYSVTPIGNGLYEYDVLDGFRKYDNALDSFVDYCELITGVERYKEALEHKDNYKLYLPLIAKAGYATGVGYANLCVDVGRMIEGQVRKLETTIYAKKNTTI